MQTNTTNHQLRIGFTERGDGGLDLSWEGRLSTVDGAIIVTKNLTSRIARSTIIDANERKPIIVHAGCTGMGSSLVEPCVPHPTKQLDAIAKLIAEGFSAERIVLRIDPIIPTPECVHAAGSVIAGAIQRGILPRARLRISIIDNYSHVVQRFRSAGLTPLYDGAFQASQSELELVADMLAHYLPRIGGTAYACAEPVLAGICHERGINLVMQGCLSTQDLELMGIDTSLAPTTVNGQNRSGCLCLRCKTELLRNPRRPCKHGCLYCYWRG